jgi:hypothetical protein
MALLKYGSKGNEVIDLDIDEALEMKKDIDHDLLNLAYVLAK